MHTFKPEHGQKEEFISILNQVWRSVMEMHLNCCSQGFKLCIMGITVVGTT